MKYLIITVMLLSTSLASEKIGLKGGKNKWELNDPSSKSRPFYEVLKFNKGTNRYKWVGLFYNSFADEVKENPNSYKFARKAQIYSYIQIPFLIAAPSLLFAGVNTQNSQPEDSEGKKELSPTAIGLVVGAFGSLAGFGVCGIMGKKHIQNAAIEWNKTAINYDQNKNKFSFMYSMKLRL